MIDPFSYDDAMTPDGYRCSECGADGVKLWREFIIAKTNPLLCAVCVSKWAIETGRHDEPVIFDDEGFQYLGIIRTRFIGDFVPAIPTEDGRRFSGPYIIKDEAMSWWMGFKTYKRDE